MNLFPSRKINDSLPVSAIPWRMYFLIAVTGLLFSAMVGYGFHMGARMNSVFTPLVNDSVRIRLEAKVSALMFEEMIHTGIAWNFETNWESFDQAVQEMQNKLEQIRHRRRIFLPFRAATVQIEIKDVEDTFAELKKLAKDRLAGNDIPLLISEADRRYQEVYSDLISQLKRMESNLRVDMKENLRRFRYVQTFLLAACLLISIAAGIVFLRFERHRAQNLLSLYHAKEMMEKEILVRKKAEHALYERTEALEQSNRDLEQYTHVVSHDLQEPLGMVTGYLQLLSRRYHGRFDKDADQFIGYAVDGTQRMQAMIKALLKYSRVGTKAKPAEPMNTDNSLDLALANLALAIEECNAVITRGLLPRVRADESQLVQLFQNLISNAIKFRGKIPVRIHISAQQKNGDWVISIRDNGIGIDPRFSERIFTIFQRLHTAAEYPGTGIGLAICRKIVERHGGRIWMSSEPGEGSTFFFTLPKDEVL